MKEEVFDVSFLSVRKQDWCGRTGFSILEYIMWLVITAAWTHQLSYPAQLVSSPGCSNLQQATKEWLPKRKGSLAHCPADHSGLSVPMPCCLLIPLILTSTWSFDEGQTLFVWLALNWMLVYQIVLNISLIWIIRMISATRKFLILMWAGIVAFCEQDGILWW